MTRQTVIAWRVRYEAGGMEALADLPRSDPSSQACDVTNEGLGRTTWVRNGTVRA